MFIETSLQGKATVVIKDEHNDNEILHYEVENETLKLDMQGLVNVLFTLAQHIKELK